MTKTVNVVIALLVGSIGLMILGPFTIHEHYVFGIMALLLVALMYAPRIAQVVIGLLLAVLWLPAVITGTYIAPARVATADRVACVQKICQALPQPIYVVTNSTSHDHQGLGYAYLAQRTECDLFAVTQWKEQQPKTMVVMNEHVTFDREKTDFYELNRFGERQLVHEMDCGPNLTVTVFSK